MWDQHDFDIFEKTCGLRPGSINVSTQIGHDAPIECRIPLLGSELCTEALLDIEYINGLGAGIHTEFWGFSGNNPYDKQQEPFMTWLWSVGNTTDAELPKLFSTSYGEDEDTIPMAWSTRTNIEFQKCAARGISLLLFAAGDSYACPAEFASAVCDRQELAVNGIELANAAPGLLCDLVNGGHLYMEAL